MNLKIAGTVSDSIVDGDGIRFSFIKYKLTKNKRGLKYECYKSH